MNRPCIMIYVEEPATRSVIEQIVSDMDLELYPVGQGAPLGQYVKTLAPRMMILDLSGLSADWLYRHIAEIKNSRPNFPILALLAGGDEGAKRRLESAGVRSVFVKSQLEKALPQAIEAVLRMQG